MKKWLIVCVLVVLALLIALGAFLAVRFFRLYQTQNATEPPASVSVEDYAQDYLTAYDARYDAASATLTLTKQTNLSYDEACKHGASIYEGELAPDTYLPQVRSLLLDVAAKCGISDLKIILQYESSDGEAIFTVSSDGTVDTCWDTANAIQTAVEAIRSMILKEKSMK